jgi:hypothetical protein
MPDLWSRSRVGVALFATIEYALPWRSAEAEPKTKKVCQESELPTARRPVCCGQRSPPIGLQDAL